MKEERLQEIIAKLEKEPEKPVFFTMEQEAVEAYGLLWGPYPAIRLAVVGGLGYLAISDAAIMVLVERLERERNIYQTTLQNYNRQITWVKSLLGTGRSKYCNSRGVPAPPTEAERRQAEEDLLARHGLSGK